MKGAGKAMEFEDFRMTKKKEIDKAVKDLISAMTYTGRKPDTLIRTELVQESAADEVADSVAFVLETEGIPVCVPDTGIDGEPCWKKLRCLNRACMFRERVTG